MDKSNDCIITCFDYGRLLEQTTIPIITVYNRPDDYPDKFVARVWDVNRPTNLVAVAETHEQLLEAIPIHQMTRMGGGQDDDPVIVDDDPVVVEVWI